MPESTLSTWEMQVSEAIHKTWYESLHFVHTIPEVINMDRDEKSNQKKTQENFNSVTQKVKPENQNQSHNSRCEGMGPNTKRKD